MHFYKFNKNDTNTIGRAQGLQSYEFFVTRLKSIAHWIVTRYLSAPKGVFMYTYEDAVKQLQETGHISLLDFKTLSYDDLEELLDEIKKWCVYANGNTDKLEKKSKKKKKKKDKDWVVD